MWHLDVEDRAKNLPILCFQVSSTSGAIEAINLQPFEANYTRWRPFDVDQADALLHFQINADGFRTWLSRAGNVTGTYLSLSQLPVEMLNKSENVNLVSLVPAGVDMMEVLRVVADDITRMHSGPVKLWLADQTNGQFGRWVGVQPVFAFLKGDTPQRTIYTSTSGSTGYQLCHACNANPCTFFDAYALTQQRRTKTQWCRVKCMIADCNSNQQINDLRKRFGFTKAGLTVSKYFCHKTLN